MIRPTARRMVQDQRKTQAQAHSDHARPAAWRSRQSFFIDPDEGRPICRGCLLAGNPDAVERMDSYPRTRGPCWACAERRETLAGDSCRACSRPGAKPVSVSLGEVQFRIGVVCNNCAAVLSRFLSSIG